MEITTSMKEELREARVVVDGSCNLELLPTLFMEPIIPEQRQDDQRETAQIGLCFMLGRESTGLLFLILNLKSQPLCCPRMRTGRKSISEVGVREMN